MSHSVLALMRAPTKRMYAETNASSVTAHGTARIVSTSGVCDWSSRETTAVSASSQARSWVRGVVVRGCDDDVEAFCEADAEGRRARNWLMIWLYSSLSPCERAEEGVSDEVAFVGRAVDGESGAP